MAASGDDRLRLNRGNRMRIRHIPGQRVTYLQNPKVATRTIESSMWEVNAPGTAPDNPHAEPDRAPFLKPQQIIATPAMDHLLAADFFTVVRNPYARFLSAYIDKVTRAPWQRVSSEFGLSPDNQPTPDQLLSIMADLDAYQLNPHFRPQHLVVLHGLAPIDHVGHLEDMAPAVRWLADRGITVRETARPYATGANDLLTDRLGESALRRIEDYYAADFEHFGYKADPTQLHPVVEADRGAGTRDRLRAALRASA